MYHGLSRHIARTEVFSGQLNQANSVTKAVRLDESSERAEFRTGSVERETGSFYPKFMTGGCILFDPGSDPENRDYSPADYYPGERSRTSAVTREIVDTRGDDVLPSGSECSTVDMSGLRCRDRWDSPEPTRESFNPGLSPLEQVFRDINSESDALGDLVTPFVGAHSPGYSTSARFPSYASEPLSSGVTYRQQVIKFVKNSGKVEGTSVCEVTKKHEAKEEEITLSRRLKGSFSPMEE